MANDIELQYTGEQIKKLLDFINNLEATNDNIKINKVDRKENIEEEATPGKVELSLQWIEL